ncbi:hypothetical protein [Variovorax sp. PBL-H6]|uniref:hypothetical protein n=1 Tax=Variovorax sp. PBL-H6 TaxID=434009 RepID=UPI0013A54392|nr:hypothetical protein [Variovorax sp. PBL-H6]
MKRSELYALVWQTPLRHLGPKLGLSDVGLSKLCRRYDIPVPPVGYWTRLAAGKTCVQTTLPPSEIDHEVHLPEKDTTAARSSDATRVQQIQQAFSRAKDAVVLQSIDVPPSLDHCHPLVAKTARFFQSIERDEAKLAVEAEEARRLRRPFFGGMSSHKMSLGRYVAGSGCLRITATLTHIDWILRFHEALIRGLIAGGCQVVADRGDASNTVEIRRAGGAIKLNFSEQVEKIAQPRHQDFLFHRDEYRALDGYKLKLERDWHVIARQWTGSREQLEQQLPEITRALIAFPEAEVLRSKLLAEEAAIQRKQEREAARAHNVAMAAEQARTQRREARANQLPRAAAAGQSLEAYHSALNVLSRLEGIADDQPEDDALRTWIALVRNSLKDPVHELADALRAEAAQPERPLWWPE